MALPTHVVSDIWKYDQTIDTALCLQLFCDKHPKNWLLKRQWQKLVEPVAKSVAIKQMWLDHGMVGFYTTKFRKTAVFGVPNTRAKFVPNLHQIIEQNALRIDMFSCFVMEGFEETVNEWSEEMKQSVLDFGRATFNMTQVEIVWRRVYEI
jgi:hypothetical protein